MVDDDDIQTAAFHGCLARAEMKMGVRSGVSGWTMKVRIIGRHGAMRVRLSRLYPLTLSSSTSIE